MNRIKIGYFADGLWSHIAFEKIIKDPNLEIIFITPRENTKDEKLKQYSDKYGIQYLKSSNINSEKFIKYVKSLNCDLFVSMSFNQIFREEIINIPKLKTINCHAGKLPFYRGRNILNWVLINDEKEFGITVHYIDKGIDTGDIINQEIFPITDKDDYSTLLNVAYTECANVLYKSIKMIQNGNFETIKQTTLHPLGMYCGMRKKGDENLDWNQSSRDVFNFVRAICTPGPQAHTYKNNQLIKINKVKFHKNAPIYKGNPGQILCKNSEGNFIVKTKNSFIEVIEYEGTLRVGEILGFKK